MDSADALIALFCNQHVDELVSLPPQTENSQIANSVEEVLVVGPPLVLLDFLVVGRHRLVQFGALTASALHILFRVVAVFLVLCLRHEVHIVDDLEALASHVLSWEQLSHFFVLHAVLAAKVFGRAESGFWHPVSTREVVVLLTALVAFRTDQGGSRLTTTGAFLVLQFALLLIEVH